MGRASIVSEIGEGRYTLSIDYGDSERLRLVADAERRIAEEVQKEEAVLARIGQLEAAVAAAQLEYEAAAAAVAGLIA